VAEPRIPADVDELYLDLGKAIASLANHEEFDRFASEAPDAQFIELGRQWCLTNRSNLRAVADLAEHAQEGISADADPVASFSRAARFLRNAQPRYFAEIFRLGTAQKGRKHSDFLTLLREIVD
jgi:hypothetical protein